jgi:phosphoribosylformimino-5-aminoimidazole carboxamide ribotide isomerase
VIVPSIDLMEGATVQLVGGERRALELGDPRPFARRFAPVGEVAVVDLDAALQRGRNEALVRELLGLARCRVGGGIRSVADARRWLDAGAARIVLGTAARPEILRELPRERIVVALDALDGEVVVDGWRTRTGHRVAGRMRELRGLSGGFLVTFVEREGRMEGTALERVAELVAAAGDARVTIAGGITTAAEVAELDRLGADAQVGMALYTGRLGLAEAFAAPLRSDRADGLWPTLVVEESGELLGLAWSDLDSLRVALEARRGVYRSRTRGLWRKGDESGATQELVSVALDCDRDALRFTIRQRGRGFCHRGTWSCFDAEDGSTQISNLEELVRRLSSTGKTAAPVAANSYTKRLLADPALLRAKLIEEAGELADANDSSSVVHEAADLLYFTSVALARAGIPLAQVEAELARRSLRVTRRGGDAKPAVAP